MPGPQLGSLAPLGSGPPIIVPTTPGTPVAVEYVSADTGNLAAGFARTFSARIRDAAGMTVTDYVGSIIFTKTSGAGTVTGLPQTVVVTNGVATSALITGVGTGSVTIAASSAPLTSASISFTVATAAFGPVVGNLTGTAALDAVKANTAPHAVTEPSYVTTHIFSTDDTAAIRTKVRAAATTDGQNAVVYFHKGFYNVRGAGSSNNQVLYLNPWADGMTLVFESAAGYVRTSADSAVWDGGGTAMSCMIWAFQERSGSASTGPGSPHPKNITVRGGTFQNTGHDGGAYWSWAAAVRLDGPGHTIEDVIVQNYWNGGVELQGGWAANTAWAGSPWPAQGFPAPTTPSGDSTMRRVYAYRCGTSGLGGSTDYATHGHYYVLNCRARENCQRGLLPSNDPERNVEVGNSHANTKFFVNNATFDGNWVHDSISFGLWNDWFHFNTTFTNNIQEQNNGPMFLEANMGGTYVQHNYFKNNGNDSWGTPSGTLGVPFACGNLQFCTADATGNVATQWAKPTQGSWPDSAPQVGETLTIDVSYNVMDNYGDGPPNAQPPAGEYMFLPHHPMNVVIDNYNRGGTNFQCKGIKVHHNQFWVRGTGWSNGKWVTQSYPGASGYVVNATLIWSEISNEFHHNEYHVSSLTAKNWVWWRQFSWNVYNGVPYKVNDPTTWEEWVGAVRADNGASMNHEVGSTRVLI